MTSLPSTYNPQDIEEKWRHAWKQMHLFHADASSQRPAFSMVIPPPNVTGVLHMGHALVNSLQDFLVRLKRMQGYEAVWIPGTDHAGIATQAVVERRLLASSGKRRRDMSREEFLRHVWEWKETSEMTILSQIEHLGCSCDMSRLAFTMDAPRSLAVRTFFKRLFDEGLIYRGHYLVNWDPLLQTALSDDEVEEEERDSFLWHIHYPIEGSQEYITVATTRPETLLGDVAVAVHPHDTRYQHLVGRSVRLPLTHRLIPILQDAFVDPAFGTGAVKITPAHDFNDFEVARRHALPFLNIMTSDGRILEGPFEGLSMQEARTAVLHQLKIEGRLGPIQPHKLRLRLSDRSKAEIQPYLSKQWFVRAQPFKEKLISAVRDKKVRLVPAHWEETYFHWIEHLRDWCISRQLWWGHQIPIWYRKEDPEQYICYAGEGLPDEVARDPAAWIQDPDVLDTWFSSALWPLSVFGWPESTADQAKFYPTSTLITGHDILFFWVARMILAAEYLTGQMPFREVFLHGLIYGKSYWRTRPDGSLSYIEGDEKRSYDLGATPASDVAWKWEKMSKSKGNVIDPLAMVAEYGCDAVRITLASITTHARQIDLDVRRFEESKNFVNKIWNASRFVLLNLEAHAPSGRPALSLHDLSQGLIHQRLALEDRWILSRLSQTIQAIQEQFNAYAFDQAALLFYRFFWDELCAIYLELTKPILFGKRGDALARTETQKVLFLVLFAALRLFHPIAPFITEEVCAKLRALFPESSLPVAGDPYTREALQALAAPSCAQAPYPQILTPVNPSLEAEFRVFLDIVHAIRNIRAEMAIPPSEKTNLLLFAPVQEQARLHAHAYIILTLTPTNAMQLLPAEQGLEPQGATALVGPYKLCIPIPDALRAQEMARLEKEEEKCRKLIASTKARLMQDEFLTKAPPEVVAKLQTTLHEAEAKLCEIQKKR